MSIRQDSLKELNNFQKFLGNINWLCSTLEKPNNALNNLFKTLEGETVLNTLCIIMRGKEKKNSKNKNYSYLNPD